MNTRFIILLILISSCCKDEPIKPVDECPTCSSLIEVNDVNWPSKPYFANFYISESNDTSFTLEIDQTVSIKDNYYDALLLHHIPFKIGHYSLDSNLMAQWGTDISFHIFEVEYGTAAQIYQPILDGSNIIDVESINKSTGEFVIEFDLKLFPYRDPNGEVHNFSYPVLIHFQGQAQGLISQ